MSKVYGTKKDYKPVWQDGSRVIVCYGAEPCADGEHYIWNECFWYKKPHPVVTIEEVKEAIITTFNEETKQRIVETFEWNGKAVWLSETNQHNYKAAYDLAVQTKGTNLPYKIKVGEEDSPEYIEFATVSEFKDFYLAVNEHINKCIADGWAKKDGVDWEEYESGLKAIYGE